MENFKAETINAATVGLAPKRKVLSQFNAHCNSTNSWDYKRSKLFTNVGENKENAENPSTILSKSIVTGQSIIFGKDPAISNTCEVKPILPDRNRIILVAKRKRKVEESKVKAKDHEQKAAEKPEIKRQLPMRQKLECLMGQIEDLFNGKPTKDLGMTKLVSCDTLATVEPYKLDLLQNELKKESRYNFSSDFPKEFAEQRYEVVTQIIGIVKNNELDHETLHVGIYIVDAFLPKVLQTLSTANIDLNVLALVAINIASKSQSHTNKSQIVKEIEDIIWSKSPKKRIMIPKFNKMEECILKELKFQIVPPTSIILKDLVISQMDFPTSMMQWLTSETASTVLKEAILDYKLVSIPSSKKAKLVVQICTKYFMRELPNYNFVAWNEKSNLPLERDDVDYLVALKSVAEFQCGKRFLSYFTTKSKLSPFGNSIEPSNMVTRSRAS